MWYGQKASLTKSVFQFHIFNWRKWASNFVLDTLVCWGSKLWFLFLRRQNTSLCLYVFVFINSFNNTAIIRLIFPLFPLKTGTIANYMENILVCLLYIVSCVLNNNLHQCTIIHAYAVKSSHSKCAPMKKWKKGIYLQPLLLKETWLSMKKSPWIKKNHPM